MYSIEEGLIYTNLQPIFEEFMRLMASKKIRYGKVPPSYQKDLSKYCQEVNELMSFEDPGDVLTPDLLQENSYQCSFIKSIMNVSSYHIRNYCSIFTWSYIFTYHIDLHWKAQPVAHSKHS